MKIVCISDTHSLHGNLKIPSCDILIHAGDFTGNGSLDHLINFCEWLKTVPAKYKWVTAGNHDKVVQENPEISKKHFLDVGANLLLDESITLNRLNFYFSPWTPEFFNWWFMYPRDDGKEVWDKIPEDTDVLVTHGPPLGILDLTNNNVRAGCGFLRDKINSIKIKTHIFGHIHEGYGKILKNKSYNSNFINASICNLRYKPVNKPIEIEL